MKYFLVLILCVTLSVYDQNVFSGEKITEEFVVEKLSGKNRALNYAQPKRENSTPKPSPGISFNIRFDLNSAVINEASYDTLVAIGKSLEGDAFVNLNFMIIGHTDSMGAERYNLALSLKRAVNVKNFITSSFSVSDDKLIVKGLGQSSPIAPNDTKANRAKNRRVEIVPVR